MRGCFCGITQTFVKYGPVPVWQSPRTLGMTYSRVHHD